jgi:nitric oxide reductase FlRd-NAD(+) reductase
VVAAAGLRPETALARHAGLQINRGVVVNSQLQTSDPAIYALGDCAEINGRYCRSCSRFYSAPCA